MIASRKRFRSCGETVAMFLRMPSPSAMVYLPLLRPNADGSNVVGEVNLRARGTAATGTCQATSCPYCVLIRKPARSRDAASGSRPHRRKREAVKEDTEARGA